MFKIAKSEVFNRGAAPDSFLNQLVAWAKTEPDEVFARNEHYDIFSKVVDELGPYPPDNLTYRKAVLLDVLRVLALFESECDWNCGVDSSRRTATTKENAEAGAFQESYDGRRLDPSLKEFLVANGILDGLAFQQRMKADRNLAIGFAALLLRIDVKDFNRIANGPLRKGEERKKTWPDRPKLWSAQESVYPWLKRGAVEEFKAALLAV